MFVWVAAALPLASAALAAPPPPSRLAALKQMERDLLLAEPAEELREGPSVARIARELRRRDDLREGGPPAHARPSGTASLAPFVAGDLVPPNLRLNDRASEHALFSAQAEVSLAAIGPTAIAAWNDGEDATVTGSGIAVGASTDGGRSWRKLGPLPRGSSVGLWTSDPVVAADERRGHFFLTALLVTTTSRNGLGVVRASLADTGVVLEPPVIVRTVRDTLPDKPWLVADSLTGRLYLGYTAFFGRGPGLGLTDQIEFQRWSPPVVLSPPEETGLVHGARLALGPDGELHLAWKTLDTTLASAGRDWIRIRSSRDGGRSFGPMRTITDVYTNFGSGAPGYNRAYGFAFPSLAVDRSAGPFRGRIYAAWNESVPFYDDTLGFGTPVAEREPDDVPSNSNLFTVGQTLLGTTTSSGDVDIWHFFGERGQTAVFFMDSLDTRLDLAMRLFCGDYATALAYSADGGRRRNIVFTLPTTGDYYLRVTQNGNGAGGYRILSALHRPSPGRARDHRDVFVAHSDDGFRWSTPVRVNDDLPWFDDWLPEVGVSAKGKVVVSWYDWRQTPDPFCGGWSLTAAAVSSDGGETWGPSSTIADAFSRWSQVLSNQTPNQGDYLGLWVAGDSAWVAWADGRSGDPDAFAAVFPLIDHPAPQVPSRPLVWDGPWPHPVSGPITMRLWLPDARATTVDLLDASGRRCRTLRLVPRGPGWQWVDLATAGLRPGLYFVHAVQGGGEASRKIVLLR